MAAEWIEEQRRQLTEVYNKCKGEKKPEPILEAFSVYLLRILNGLSQMESSKLYGYETQILGEAMRLFCIHYSAQVDKAMGENVSGEGKKEIIEDIEDAISKISNVYKNVIDSTSNSDRQMFTNQAVETSIYDISPKFFSTYSVILGTLVRLFGKQDVYAFLLHPSLKSNIETTSLFDKREVEGKVVLIYIPENEIEKRGQIPIYLLHEAFHVLTKEERNRKDRGCRMDIHVHNAICQRLFKNVDFSFLAGDSSEDVEENIKKELMERWFKLDEHIQELEKYDKGDRMFYSKNITQEVCKKWRVWLGDVCVNLGKDLLQVIDGKTYKQGREPYSELVDIEWEIQRNLVEILADNFVAQCVSLYMSIYRETYADVACILTAGISPEQYEQAFRHSETFGFEDVLEPDIMRAIRIHIVAKSIADCLDNPEMDNAKVDNPDIDNAKVDYAKEWREYSDDHDFRKQYGAESQNGKEQKDVIHFLDTDLDTFEKITKSCSQKLWEQLGKKDSVFEKFRKIIKQMGITGILNGKVNEELRNLCL